MKPKKRLLQRIGSASLVLVLSVSWATPAFAQVRGKQLPRYVAPTAEDRRVAREQRRKAALEKMDRITNGPRQRELAKKAKEDAARVIAAVPDGKLRHELARQRAFKTPEAQVRTKLAALSPKFDSASRSLPALRKPDVFAPKRLIPERKAPPAPRQTPSGWRGERSLELEALYASVDGEAWVEQPDGSLLSVSQVLQPISRPPVLLASSASDFARMLPLIGALPAPTPEDLAQTPETRRTPELVALAESLGGKPLALYNYVHGKVNTELYAGSKKGAAATLAEGAGNDFDQAALLIALLRTSGVPARYEYGTVRLTLEQAQALTGAPDATRAAQLLAASGLSAGVGADGQTVLVERAWVRAHVPYGDWRGTGRGGEPTWVRLDPSLKRVTRKAGVNLRNVAQFNFDAYLAALTGDTPKDIYERQLLGVAKARNLCNTLDDALPVARVVQEDFKLLPAEHPAEVVSSLLLFARPPATMRHEVLVTLDGQTQTFELAELEGRSVSLTYVGATAADQAALNSPGGIAAVVPYQVRVIPVLSLDGVEARRFNALMPGLVQDLGVRVTLAGATPANAVHRVTAGGVYALSVAAGAPAAARVEALRRAITTATGDARLLAEAQLAAALYSRMQQSDANRLFALEAHTSIQDVLEVLTGKELEVETVNGTPVSLQPGLYVIDVARDSLTPLPLNGDGSRVPYLARLAGHHGSALEHKVWEQVFATAAVSAVKIIQAAGTQLVPVYQLTQGSADRARLTGFSSSTLNDIDEALAAGWRVRVPQRPVSFATYQDQEGYILENPALGTGAYRINMMLNGGGTEGGNNNNDNDCPTCSSDEISGHSKINSATGNWREFFTDLTLPAIGIPIVFRRTYASRGQGVTPMGYGWMHNYAVQLRAEPDGDMTYVMDDWREARFDWNGTSFVTPAAYPGLTLTRAGTELRLRTKEGMSSFFDASGKLLRLAEPSGNTVQLVYTGALLTEVRDSDNRVALSLAYTGGKLTTVTDRAGRSVSFTHSGDNLTSATDVLGHTESYAYDAEHNLTQRTDKRRKVWSNFYDDADRWTGARNPLGNEVSLQFDWVARQTVYTDAVGSEWRTEYNANGNPTAKVDPLGNRTEMTWDAAQNKTSTKDARGFITSMTYDAKGNLRTRTDPDGRVTSITYDANFNGVTETLATGLPRTFATFDAANGRLLTSNDSVGTTSYAYDGRGQLRTVTQPGTAVTTLGYDAFGNVLTVTDPTSRVTTLGYDTAGHLTSTTDGNNKTRTIEVDAAGRVRAMVDATSQRTELTYDPLGHRLTAEDAANGVTTFVYDDAERLVRTTDALGGNTLTQYDATGRVVAVTDARGSTRRTRYNAAGHVEATVGADGATTAIGHCADVSDACVTVDAEGGISEKAFDNAGRVTTLTDPLGQVTTSTYDAGGRVRSTSGPGQAPQTYTYGTNGLVQSVASAKHVLAFAYDGRGNRITYTSGSGFNAVHTRYTYDLANRLLTETNPLNKVTTYTYDAAGNRRTKLDANGHTTTYVYDDNRRLLETQFQDGTKYEYAYDTRGNRTLEKSPDHERTLQHDALGRVKTTLDVTLGKTLEYTYDASGNRTQLREGSLVHSYTYDVEGRLKTATGPGGTLTFDYDSLSRRTLLTRPNGVNTSYSYDSASQVLDIVHAKAGSVLSRFTYTYDDGNRVSKAMADGSVERYEYDADRRLTAASYGTDRVVTYTLDGPGNRTQMREVLAVPGGTQTNTTNYFNNEFNQLTLALESCTGIGCSPSLSTSFVYDNNGNLLSESSGPLARQYTWRRDDRLGSSAVAGVADQHAYDANGLRVSSTAGGLETTYLLDGRNVFKEIGLSQRVLLTNPQRVDELLSFSTQGSSHWPLQDAIGSIVGIADVDGRLIATNTYDAYGERGNTSVLSFGFTGREHDSSGLLYHRDRYLSPTWGRWLQADRIGFDDGPNRYQYVRSSPTSRTDPSGQKTVIVTFSNIAEWHAVLYLDSGPNNEPVLYNPGGTWATHPYGWQLTGEPDIWKEYVDYYKAQGDEPEVFTFNTNPEQEREIAKNYDSMFPTDPGPGYCSYSITSVLDRSEPFQGVGVSYRPSSFASSLRSMIESRERNRRFRRLVEDFSFDHPFRLPGW